MEATDNCQSITTVITSLAATVHVDWCRQPNKPQSGVKRAKQATMTGRGSEMKVLSTYY